MGTRKRIEGGDLFQGVAVLTWKIKWNLKYLMAKNFFFVITKNLNWEISAKNLVTLKGELGLMIKKFKIMGVHWKIRFLPGEVGGRGAWKKTFSGWSESPKKEGLGYFADIKGDLAKEGVVFLRWGGVEIPMHTMSWSLLIDTNIQSK